MEQSVAKVAKASSKGPFASNQDTNVAETKIVKSPNIIETVVSTVDCKSVLPWECVVTVSTKYQYLKTKDKNADF